MPNIHNKKKYNCLLFGEGRNEKNFLYSLVELDNFKFHTEKWKFSHNNASGGSPKDILKKCFSVCCDDNLVVCFIDLDKLKHDYKKTWNIEKKKLEDKYCGIKIVWQENNLEEEFVKVLGERYKNKFKLNNIAKKDIKNFINSDFYKRILESIKDKEKELEENKE